MIRHQRGVRRLTITTTTSAYSSSSLVTSFRHASALKTLFLILKCKFIGVVRSGRPPARLLMRTMSVQTVSSGWWVFNCITYISMVIYPSRSKGEAVMLAPLSRMLCGPRSAPTLGSPILRRPKGRSPLATRRYVRACWRTMHSITRYETQLRVDLALMISSRIRQSFLAFVQTKSSLKPFKRLGFRIRKLWEWSTQPISTLFLSSL